METDDDALPPAAHTHDGFFKAVFSDPEHAGAFFQSHLPPNIVAHTDWSTLSLIPGSFVRSSLAQMHSDLLFSVRVGARETLLYLVFEHQSRPDPAMPLRLLGYVTEIFLKHHKEHGFPLPAVLPFVFHQGPDAWNISTAFEDLFELPANVADDLLPFLPKFHHALLDLTRFDPASLESDTRIRAILQLMKLARQMDLLIFFRWLAGFSARDFPENLLTLMLLYALHADSNLDVEKIYHNLSSNPELEKNAMSVAEKLIAKGRVEGRDEGFWIGRILFLEEILGHPATSRISLESVPLEDLEVRHDALRQEYDEPFKRH